MMSPSAISTILPTKRLRADNLMRGIVANPRGCVEAFDCRAYACRVGDKLSSGRAPLLAPSPLRTGLEGFPSSGSSAQKRSLERRGRGLIQNEADLLDTGLLPIRTAAENPPGLCEAATTACHLA